MPSYIPRLARIVSGIKTGAGRRHGKSNGSGGDTVNVERLARLVPQIRHRLSIGHALTDEALLASLVAIARHPSHEARWHAAEASTLGHHLAISGRDMRRTLVTLLSLLPKPTA
jgi:hypothetical protein